MKAALRERLGVTEVLPDLVFVVWEKEPSLSALISPYDTVGIGAPSETLAIEDVTSSLSFALLLFESGVSINFKLILVDSFEFLRMEAYKGTKNSSSSA